jgi:hypothetical protein
MDCRARPSTGAALDGGGLVSRSMVAAIRAAMSAASEGGELDAAEGGSGHGADGGVVASIHSEVLRGSADRTLLLRS